MKKLTTVFLLLGLLISLGSAWAAVPVGALNDLMKYAGPVRGSGALDELCTANFLGFTFGSYRGSEIWPGGNGTYYMTGYLMSTSCDIGDTLNCYCMDLDHSLAHGPYCTNIDPMMVRAAYPEQYPAMAYMMSWYPAVDEAADRMLQLGLWKMTNDNRASSPTYGAPWYTIEAGRGYPNVNDLPVYPYVNTVYNTEAPLNSAVNERVRHMLGTDDGIAKNVAVCGDQFTITTAHRVNVTETTSEVPVTIQLVRGPNAQAVNNTALSGVRVLITVSSGTPSVTEAFTDAAGQVHLTVSQSAHFPENITMQVCSHGGWVQSVTPCEGYSNQQLITLQPCQICITREIPGDEWLPVELAGFTATAGEHDIRLNWRTASESSLSAWEIERSVAGSSDFARIGSVEAANLASGHDYAFADDAAQRGVTYAYRLVDVAMNGQRTVHGDLIRTAGLSETPAALTYELAGNFPNPFNPETSIRFTLGESGFVSMKVYDVTGKEVSTLLGSKLAAGEHTVSFRAGNLPSGIYFYKLSAGSFSQTRKMVLAK